MDADERLQLTTRQRGVRQQLLPGGLLGRSQRAIGLMECLPLTPELLEIAGKATSLGHEGGDPWVAVPLH
jgi:hypothetical protein